MTVGVESLPEPMLQREFRHSPQPAPSGLALLSRTRRQPPVVSRRPAFLLLTVLVAIVVSGLLLAATARHSLTLARDVIAGGRDLQLKWGARSCRRSVLPAAAEVFGDNSEPMQEAGDSLRMVSLRTGAVEAVVLLGGIPFRLQLSDEDAKVSVNTLYHFAGLSSVNKYLSGPWRRVPIRLLPEVESKQLLQQDFDEEDSEEKDDGPPPAFRSWGQVVDFSVLGEGRSAMPALTVETTCWGSGQLNVTRATDASVSEVGRLVVSRGEIGRFLRELRKYPERSIETQLDQLSIDQEDRFLLQELLGESSSSYGLWIVVGAGRTALQQFSVAQRIDVLDDAGKRSFKMRTQSFDF